MQPTHTSTPYLNISNPENKIKSISRFQKTSIVKPQSQSLSRLTKKDEKQFQHLNTEDPSPKKTYKIRGGLTKGSSIKDYLDKTNIQLKLNFAVQPSILK